MPSGTYTMDNITYRNKGSNDYSIVNSSGSTDNECDNVEIPRSDTEGTSLFTANTSSDSDGVVLENQKSMWKSDKSMKADNNDTKKSRHKLTSTEKEEEHRKGTLQSSDEKCYRCCNMRKPTYCERVYGKARCAKCLRDQQLCLWLDVNGRLRKRKPEIEESTGKIGKHLRMGEDTDESLNHLEEDHNANTDTLHSVAKKNHKGKGKEIEREINSDDEIKAIEREIMEAEARVKVANDVLEHLRTKLFEKKNSRK